MKEVNVLRRKIYLPVQSILLHKLCRDHRIQEWHKDTTPAAWQKYATLGRLQKEKYFQ